MSFSQRLELKQSQQLVMTPQLQQAIRMLQMSGADIAAFVAEEVERNPVLELESPDRETQAAPAEKAAPEMTMSARRKTPSIPAGKTSTKAPRLRLP